MANRSELSSNRRTSHLDASGPREVVFCHQCTNEWYQDIYGLVCPHCDGGITEIIIPGNDDPRHFSHQNSPTSPRRNRHNSSESTADSQNIDFAHQIPHISNETNPSRTTITSEDVEEHNDITDHVLRDFHGLISSILGPQPGNNTFGRSGPETTFEPSIHTSTFRFGGNGNPVTGGRITFTSTFSRGPIRPGYTNENQSGDALPINDLTSLIENILAPIGEDTANPQGRPVGLPGIFSAMFFPSNGRAGDAVYSQEAFDQIISTLMEQSPNSNAPGPASAEAIAALPKKKLDASLIGFDGKGECSICMDEIKVGQEVVVLPCNHWFDETCIKSWLREHNTCPICRKGIKDENNAPRSPNSRSPTSTSRNGHRIIRLSSTRSGVTGENRMRNEERLNYLRNAAGANLSEGHEPENIVSRMPGSFHSRSLDTTDIGDNTNSSMSQDTRRRSASGNSGNIGGNGPLNWLRGIHDRLSNNRRNEQM
ncbi:hypothetical protein K3495_g12014 [Podosphaera aphanis]|nr:hypothetical protein K3495_g12014 [Podosphaera aphanis]